MKIRPCICVMVAFYLLLLSCLEMGWAVVLDDSGNLITEAEIRASMEGGYRIGGVIGGGLLSAVPAYIGFRKVEDIGIPLAIWVEVIGIIEGYRLGKRLDRRRFIQQRGWTETILDDEGKVITEAEIKANMGLGNRMGCVIAAGSIGLIPAVVGGFYLMESICDIDIGDCWGICTITCAFSGRGDDCGSDCFDLCFDHCADNYGFWFYIGFIAVETSEIIVSYCMGKHYDRKRAIERIKDQRRKQKEHAFGSQNTNNGFYFKLLKGTF